MSDTRDVDVLIVGGGLAGLTLARQILLETDKRVLLVDRRAELPSPRQKVGEATVQVSAFYLARVLDLEEHLLREHFLKYNLRFYWPAGDPGDRYEALSQSYIRSLSNIATYQLDRNKLEAEVLRLNREDPRFELLAPVTRLDIDLSEEGAPHAFRLCAGGAEIEGKAEWVVDASGRGKVLAKRRGLGRKSPIRHGSTFFWVEGLVDPERLTGLSPAEIRRRPDRSALGHLPAFLATNHFCGEGFWFWVIPLHGKTSLGLVYDVAKVDREQVSTPEKTIAWICERFPLFARDLPGRRVLDHGGFTDFAYDGAQTLSADRWALTGEACRFSDPLYSPGGDLISVYNTLITDAIRTGDRAELASKVRLYEALARAVYEAYLPGYTVGYQVLGDQEVFSLRYAWELAIYFGFYVFPFINGLFTDAAFLPGYLRRFARLGPLNHALLHFLADYYQWKKTLPPRETGTPVFFDFYEAAPLKSAEACFYKIGVGHEEARKVLDEQLAGLESMARWMAAHIGAAVAGDPEAVWSRAFVEGIDLKDLRFDPEEIRARWERCAGIPGRYAWPFEPPPAERFGSYARRGVKMHEHSF